MTEKGEPMLLAGEATDDEIPEATLDKRRGGEQLTARRCCGEFMDELSGLLESLLLSHIPSLTGSQAAETSQCQILAAALCSDHHCCLINCWFCVAFFHSPSVSATHPRLQIQTKNPSLCKGLPFLSSDSVSLHPGARIRSSSFLLHQSKAHWWHRCPSLGVDVVTPQCSLSPSLPNPSPHFQPFASHSFTFGSIYLFSP